IELSGGSMTCTSNLAYAYAVSGKRNEAVKILNNLKNRSNHAFSNAPEVALVYVGLDEKDQAMAWLERAYAERFNPGVLLRPAFDTLRSDPRFQDLLRRIGLKPVYTRLVERSSRTPKARRAPNDVGFPLVPARLNVT